MASSAARMCFSVRSDGRCVWCSFERNRPSIQRSAIATATPIAINTIEPRSTPRPAPRTAKDASVAAASPPSPSSPASPAALGGGGANPIPGGGGSNPARATSPAPCARYAKPSGGPSSAPVISASASSKSGVPSLA